MKKRVRLWCAQTLKFRRWKTGRTQVSVGEEESGTKQNALQILAAYGLNEKLVEEVSLNYTEAAKELENGSIDAFSVRQERRRLQSRIWRSGQESGS